VTRRRKQRRGDLLSRKIIMDDFRETYVLFSFFHLFVLFSFTNSIFELATIPFHDGFTYLCGKGNVLPSIDENSVKLIIYKHSSKLNEINYKHAKTYSRLY